MKIAPAAPEMAGAPGPRPAEPAMPPPAFEEEPATMGSSSWFSQYSFSVNIFGKRLSGSAAQKVVYALLALVGVRDRSPAARPACHPAERTAPTAAALICTLMRADYADRDCHLERW